MKKFLLYSLSCAIIVSVFAFSKGTKSDNDTTSKTFENLKYPDDEQVIKEIFSAGGPFAGFKFEDEDVSLRTEHSKHFVNSDGTNTALIGSGSVHYYEDGRWKTILSHVFKNTTNKFSDRKFAAPYNKHKIYFPDKPGISIVSQTEKGVYHDWEMPKMVWLDKDGKVLSEISPNTSAVGKYRKDSIVYENIYKGIDANIVISTTTKKLNYIIKDASFLSGIPNGAVYLAFSENIKIESNWVLDGDKYSSELFAATNKLLALKNINLKDVSGKNLISLSQPIYFEKISSGSCTDANNDTSKINSDAYFEGNYLIEKLSGNSYNKKILVPVNWISKQDRKFPVTIDPITNYFPAGTFPTYTANRSGNSGSWQCFAGIYAGRANVFDISYGWVDDSWPFSNPYMDGYASFNISSIPTNATINSATNYWYRYGGRTCGDPIVLKHGMVEFNAHLAESFDCNIDGIRSRNNNSYYNGTGKNGTGWQNQAATVANVTSALSAGQITMGWAYNGGDDCCTGCVFGVCACTGNDGDYHHIYGFENSTFRPYITINYCVRPTITTQPTGYNACTNSTMTALTVAATGTALTYQWEVSNFTACNGATAASWQPISGATSSSYTPPRIAGTRLYRVVVTASDCPSNVSGRSVTSNCVRVTVNPMNGSSTNTSIPYGTGNNPPPIQFALCGGKVLPNSTHILNTLQPPAVGAVNNILSYAWSSTGGSIVQNGSSATWTAPAALGIYTITVTYTSNNSCGTFESICSVEVTSPDCGYAYVRPATNGGVDSPDRGGPDNPYATLAYAISQLGSGQTHIRMATGNYTETQRVNIPSNVIIEGRYDAANGWRKISDGSTSITFSNLTGNISTSGDSRHLIGVASNGTSGWTLQDINVTTQAVTGMHNNRGSSNYALWLNGASNYNIIRCQFTAGAASNGNAGSTPAAGGGGVGGNGGTGGTGLRGCGTGNIGGTSGAGSGGVNDGAGAVPNGAAVGSPGQSNVGDGCCSYSRYGSNGSNGNNGGNGPSWTVGDRPASPTLPNGQFFVPSGQAQRGTDGGGGSGGSGGRGSRGGEHTLACGACDGRNGGNGGRGGDGGRGGTGGFGGGGSFGVWRFNSNIGANISQVTFTSSSAGIGGSGANGSAANNGQRNSGRSNGSEHTGCYRNNRGGNGGEGGFGGAGGRGRDGANGLSVAYVVNGVNTTPPIGAIATSPIVRVLHEKGSPCINSEINLNKASGTWTLPSGLSFVNDLTNSTTSFTTSAANIKVFTTSLNTTYNLTAPLDFPGFLRTVSENRPWADFTITPSTLCVGAGAEIQLQQTNPFGTQVEYEWVIFNSTSDANSPLITSNQNNPLIDVSALAVGTYTIRFRVKEICCGWSRPRFVNFTIVQQPTVPNNLTKTSGSNVAQVCEGRTDLSVNAATGSTGGAGNCVYEYSFQNTDGIWSAWQTAIPSVTAGDAPGFVRIKARRNCDGVACNESDETPAVEWEIIDQPTAGAVSRDNPVEQFSCLGASLAVDVSGGNGGILPSDEIQWRKGTTGGWTTYTGPISTTTHGTGEYYFQTRRVSSGSGCNNSSWEPSGNGALLWFIEDAPVAPTITKNPPDAEVCVGANISANITNFGSGGAGTCQDEIRYSINGGSTWSSWSTTNPTISTSSAGVHIIQVRRKCTGGACDDTPNEISWNVVADPVITVQPQAGSTCFNANYTLSVTMGTAPGTYSYQWQESTTGCSGTWSNVGTNSNTYTTGLLTVARHYRVLINSTGTGCNSVTSNCVEVTINQNLATSTWNGNISTDWFNPYNWSNCVPGDNTVVTIPAGLSHGRYPIIITNSSLDTSGGKAKAKKVNMATIGTPPPDAKLQINSGAELKVNE